MTDRAALRSETTKPPLPRISGMPGMRAKQLHPQAYDALTEALATFTWYKPDFTRMVNSVFAADRTLLAGLDFKQSSKRENAQEIVGRLQRHEQRYQSLTIGALMTLSDYDPAFSTLARLDDGATKVAIAQASLAEVNRVIGQHKALLDDADARRAAEEAEAAAAHQRWAYATSLDELKADFYELSATTDPQKRGLAFEGFLNRLFNFYDLDPRGALVLKGEQIDGAFTFDTDDYLLEARWRAERVNPDQIRAFSAKVTEKTHRTSGLMVSINGFTTAAVDVLRRNGSRLLLLDGPDLSVILEGGLRLDEVLLRKRRHAAETGDPYLTAREML